MINRLGFSVKLFAPISLRFDDERMFLTSRPSSASFAPMSGENAAAVEFEFG
jgi:hypothetical protein